MKHCKTAIPVQRMSNFVGEAIMYWLNEPMTVGHGVSKEQSSYVVLSALDLSDRYGEPHYEHAFFACSPDGSLDEVVPSHVYVWGQPHEHWVSLAQAGYVIV